jgi:hypothetical protein
MTIFFTIRHRLGMMGYSTIDIFLYYVLYKNPVITGFLFYYYIYLLKRNGL